MSDVPTGPAPDTPTGITGERAALIAIATLVVGVIAGVMITLVLGDDDDVVTETPPSSVPTTPTTSQTPTTAAPTTTATSPPSTTDSPTTTAPPASEEGQEATLDEAVSAYRAAGACGGDAPEQFGVVAGVVEPEYPYNPDTGGSDLSADVSPRTVVGVICSQGLSNAGMEMATFVDGALQPLVLVQLELTEGGDFYESSQVVGSLQIGEETGAAHRMTLYTKDRGVGGCGRFDTWGFYGQVVNLEMVQAQTCEDFDAGNGSDDPTQWPVVYVGE